jgi:hypothetical protein
MKVNRSYKLRLSSIRRFITSFPGGFHPSGKRFELLPAHSPLWTSAQSERIFSKEVSLWNFFHFSFACSSFWVETAEGLLSTDLPFIYKLWRILRKIGKIGRHESIYGFFNLVTWTVGRKQFVYFHVRKSS